MAAQIGDLVAGRYRIAGELGAGAAGIVYAAEDTDLGRQIAIKFLRPERAAAPGARKRFHREARTSAALRHPNVVRVYDFGEHEGDLYLVMEKINGMSLRESIETRPPDLERAMLAGRDIARALGAAHQVGLVHRDIKPGNAFVSTGDRGVIVADFGLAFKVDEEGTLGRMTQEGVLGGTPYYMAPEQAQGVTVEQPADIYALGCVLFELIAGVPPFLGELPEVLAKHMYVPAPKLGDVVSKRLPPGLPKLVASMMAKETGARPVAAEVEATLETILESLNTLLPEPVKKTFGTADTDMAPVGAGVRVHCECDINEMVAVGLQSNGMVLVGADDNPDIRLIGWDESAPVVASANPADPLFVVILEPEQITRLAAVVRSGITVAVVRPVDGGDLARRIVKAIARRR